MLLMVTIWEPLLKMLHNSGRLQEISKMNLRLIHNQKQVRQKQMDYLKMKLQLLKSKQEKKQSSLIMMSISKTVYN